MQHGKMAALDEAVLQQQMGQALVDVGAAWRAPLFLIGERLGLYRALAEEGPATTMELAERTATAERYVREWLRAQAAGGYVTYDPATDRYALSPEQAAMVADENSPFYIISAFMGPVAMRSKLERLEHAFRTGDGIGWHEHEYGLYEGTERFFRPGYTAHLTTFWIPALDGVEEKLRRGARVADVGCGHGASTIIMAKAYPNSTFVGYDYHGPSIEVARRRAEEAGVGDRVRFETSSAKQYDGAPYDLVTMFDCLHDMGDPVGAAAHVRQTLKEDGTWMIVEPYASDNVADNLNPVGRIYYAASTMVCTPSSLNQEVGLALGAQAGEARLREVAMAGGFTRFRRATETPFNLVLEARP